MAYATDINVNKMVHLMFMHTVLLLFLGLYFFFAHVHVTSLGVCARFAPLGLLAIELICPHVDLNGKSNFFCVS